MHYCNWGMLECLQKNKFPAVNQNVLYVYYPLQNVKIYKIFSSNHLDLVLDSILLGFEFEGV
jgi:hypothetical protein